jgi:hypothetical protein
VNGATFMERDKIQSAPVERLIDDFEDGDAKVATVSGRSGAWVLGSDGTGVLTVENSSRCERAPARTSAPRPARPRSSLFEEARGERGALACVVPYGRMLVRAVVRRSSSTFRIVANSSPSVS